MSAKGSTVLRWSSRPARATRILDVDERLAHLVAVRNNVQESLQQSREVGHDLHARLDHLRGRLSPVITEALAPVEKTEAWTDHLDHATQCVKSVQDGSTRDAARKIIAVGEPAQDLHGYLAAVMQLEEALRCHRRELAAASRWVQEAVRCLESSASAPSDRLQRILTDLKAEQAGGTFDGGLLDVALGKLEGEFKRLLSEHCVPVALPSKMGPQTADAPFSSSELEYLFGFSPEALERMQVIITRMVATAHYQRCVDAYQESRILQCRRSLEVLGVEYLQNNTPEMIDKLPWTELQSMIQRWTQQVEVVVKVLYAGERRLARQVFKEMGQPVWVERLRAISHDGFSAFLQFGESVSRSSRSPEKLCKLLEMTQGLENSEHSVIQVFDGQACSGIRSRYRELLKQVSSGACKGFYDMREWVEEQKEPHPLDGGVMKLCCFVVNYMNFLVRDYLPRLKKALRSQHCDEKTVAEGVLLPLQALEQKVEVRAEEILDRPLRHLFLMNNFQYIYTRVDSSHLKDFLDHSWTFGVGRKVDKHTLKYRSSFCRKLLMHLNHEALANCSKSEARLVARQSVKAFCAALDEALRSRPVICHDTLREATRAYITEHVASAYRRYLDSFGNLLEGTFSSSITKYVKYSPQAVEQALSLLFSLRRQHSSSSSSNGA